MSWFRCMWSASIAMIIPTIRIICKRETKINFRENTKRLKLQRTLFHQSTNRFRWVLIFFCKISYTQLTLPPTKTKRKLNFLRIIIHNTHPLSVINNITMKNCFYIFSTMSEWLEKKEFKIFLFGSLSSL